MKTVNFYPTNASRVAVILLGTMLATLSCAKIEPTNPTPTPPGPTTGSDFFDFVTTSQIPLTINYGISGHQVRFSLYDINPVEMVDDYTYKMTDAEPLFSAFTDENAAFTGKIQLPPSVTKVYVFTQDFGMPAVDEVPITASGISLQWNVGSTRSAAITRSGDSSFSYTFAHPSSSAANPYNVSSPLGNWDITGRMSAMTTEAIVSGLTYRVQRIAPPTADNTEYAKGKRYSNLITNQPATYNNQTQQWEGGTELKVKFLWEFAGYHNALGYYYYPKNKTFTEQEFKQLPKYVVFPNMSWNETYAGNRNAAYRPDYGATPLVEGSTMKLKYFGPNYDWSEGSVVFPQDIEIGWFMMSDAFYTQNKGIITNGNLNGYLESDPNGNKTHLTYMWGSPSVGRPGSIYGAVNNLPYVFSNEEFNTNLVPGCITLYDETSKMVVIGFEDGDRRTYQDFLFYVEATPDVVNPGWSKTRADVNELVTGTAWGALVYEDLWPHKGDYDMNDVIVNYHAKVITDINNNVVKIIDTFRVASDGAAYTNGFGVELGITPDAIESITVDRKGVSCTFPTDAKGLETNQNGLAVIMLFDHQKEAFRKDIVVTINLKSSYGIKQGIHIPYPPYNPFIVVQSDKNKGQGRFEVHLPKIFRPTNLAGSLGKYDDASGSMFWYVSKPDTGSIQYPFALNIPFDSKYRRFIPSPETDIISLHYPEFVNWVKTSGQENKTWYLNFK